MSIAEKLAGLGHRLPEAPAPAANYVAYQRMGGLLVISGQVSRLPSGEMLAGTVGGSATAEEGRAAAEVSALNVLAQIAAATGGEIAAVAQVVRLGVFVASAPDFTRQPFVADAASDLIAAVFGPAGRHARAAVGVAALPGGACVEIEATVALVQP
ncbi:RidA family protein [Poseidonocella sp. HB161398]|uniref:RidA family protein n=1 Tax=Poseidonocella sp. HB161398 TaxID=2320855 RepID=UPI001109D2BD|nr:RidA family protein [Poseidonocella sp. HB161398]